MQVIREKGDYEENFNGMTSIKKQAPRIMLMYIFPGEGSYRWSAERRVNFIQPVR
jgi:hypothetical protein